MYSFNFLPSRSKIVLLSAFLVLSFSSMAASSSRSYSSGFSKPSSSSMSPSKSYTASSPPSSPSKSTGFGSFGGGKKADAISRSAPKSAMSQGLDKISSQASALKTLNARESAKTVPSGFGNSTKDASVTSTPQYSQQSPSQTTQVAHVPVYVPTPSVGNGGFSWGSAAIGYMLGRSTSHESNHQVDNGLSRQPESQATTPASVNQVVPNNSEATADTGSGMLRIILWMLIFGTVSFLIWKVLSRKKIEPAKTSHYSLR